MRKGQSQVPQDNTTMEGKVTPSLFPARLHRPLPSTTTTAACGRLDGCHEQDACCYAYGDPHLEQHPYYRTDFDFVGKTNMTEPTVAPALSTPAAPMIQTCASRDFCYGTQRQPVPLDAPDVALRGQLLLAY